MTEPRSVKEIFGEAVELPTGDRGAFLDRACGGDRALRAQVEALLAVHRGAGEFLAAPTQAGGQAAAAPPRGTGPESGRAEPDGAATVGALPGERAGAVIGRYRLLEPIGEGGFGVVFMAEQREPVVRRVALKIIKLGMDTRQVIARFEAERQALALMDHPNIAKVLDAGATATGRPYFVMELVKGEPITAYCDQNNQTIAERLGAFAQVCAAVQHAHQKGIIHRDLKPGNILVSTQDGRPHAKVVDFGIAKATDRPLTEKTLFTEHRQLIGTPEYMSPEQAEGSLDIDTRSDVYALGVLLYELLTGTTPFDARRLRSAAFAEVQRIIREEEPRKPSTRLSGMADTIASVAAQRHIEPARLRRLVRGDLDWIAMKCLEKDRARRYETANGLAMDVQRYLAGEPVVAAPPSASYRLRKFVQRHRGAVAAGAIVGAALLLGFVGASSAMVWALRERAGAQAARQTAEDVSAFQEARLRDIDIPAMGQRLRADFVAEARAGAEREGLDPEAEAAIVSRLEEVLKDLNLTNVARNTLDETIFQASIVAIRRDLERQPLIKARMLHTLGRTLRELGMWDRALAPLQEALGERRQQLGADHPDTLETMYQLGRALGSVGRFAEAEPLLLGTIKGRKRVLGEDHPDTGEALCALGNMYLFQLRETEAEALCRRALEIHLKSLGERDARTVTSMDRLGLALADLGRLAEAEAHLLEALRCGRIVYGPEHPRTLGIRGDLAWVWCVQERFGTARATLEEILPIQLRLLGNRHQNTLTSQSLLAEALIGLGEYDHAEAVLHSAAAAARAEFGPDHFDTSMRIATKLCVVLAHRGQDAEAERLARRVLAFQARAGEAGAASQPPEANLQELHEASQTLIELLNRRGRKDEGAAVEQQLHELLLAGARRPGATANEVDLAARHLLTAFVEQHRDPVLAWELALKASESSLRKNPGHLATLALACFRCGEPGRAVQLQTQAIALLPPDHSRRAEFEARLGEYVAAQNPVARGAAGAER